MSIDDSLHRFVGRYAAAPQWVKSIVGGVYSRMPPSARFGRNYDRYHQAFERLPVPQEYVQARLANTLLTALRHAPAFKEHAQLIEMAAAEPHKALLQLPLMDKEAIKLGLESFCSTALPASSRLRMFTGGSTSVPMRFYLHKGVTRAREWAATHVMSTRNDTDGDGVVLALRGRSVESAASGDGQIWGYDPIKRHLIVSSDHLEDRHMARYVEALKLWKPVYVHAFASALYPLVLWLKIRGMEDLLSQVRGVLLTSESVFEHHLAAFKSFFSCPVIVHYGHSERVLFAHTLADDPRYHFWPHYGHLELIDAQGRPITAPGQVGELVGTSFDNAVMPFVRYRTGDYGVLGRAPHPSLPGFPVVERIEGRLQEFVVCSDSRLITVTTLGAAHFEQLDHCLRIQYEQHEPGRLILRVVPVRPLSDAEKASLQHAVIEKTQGGCSVQIEEVASIELTGRGKQRLLVQHLPLQKYLGAAIDAPAAV